MHGMLFRTLFACLLLATQIIAQQPQTNTDNQRKKLAEVVATLDTVEQQLGELNLKKKALERERALLLQTIAQEQNEQAFKSSPGYPVFRVSGEKSVVLLINGREQEFYLSGVHVKLGYTDDAVKFLKRELIEGIAYLRCVNLPCTEIQLYAKKDSPSLNCQLISSGQALRLSESAPDCNNNQLTSVPSPENSNAGQTSIPTSTYSNSGASPKPTPGTDVHVKGYTRKDGTYVQPHTRSAPKRKP